ncbi:MAG TPA: hypothetical protein VGA70_12030 [Longimicrobiales bacterium]|jgi:hypothetical protein
MASNCPQCGAELFTVEHNVTGWMPTGVYCPNGCYSIHTTPVPEFEAVDSDPAPGDAIPEPVRIRYADVMRDGGSYALAYDSAEHEVIKVLLRVVRTDGLERTGYHKPQLITVDPVTYEEKSSREIDWDAADRLGYLLRPLVTSGGEIKLGAAPRALEMIRYLSLRGGL